MIGKRALTDEETREQLKNATGEPMISGPHVDFQGNFYNIDGRKHPSFTATDSNGTDYEVTLGGNGHLSYVEDGNGGVKRVDNGSPKQVHAHTLTPLKGEALDEAIERARLDHILLADCKRFKR
ncbi:hypothetical protein GOV12_02110 [Candidatus Pacearchaeota archaeon]|nr:hypothetical protein [Candidatus Pacearchaeota archaeon]